MTQNPRIALSISSRAHGSANELPTFRGALIAFDELAHRPDLPQNLEWVLFDDHGDPAQVRLLAETIVSDQRFVGVVGPMGSSEAFENAPIFDAAGLLQISPCASHPKLCQLGYTTFFRMLPNEEVQGRALATLAREKVGARTIAVVHDSDAFGNAVSDNFTSSWIESGGEVAVRLAFDHGETDFEGIATSVAGSGADACFFAVHAVEGLGVSAAIRSAGFDKPFIGTDGLKPAFFLGGGDPDAEAFHTHSGVDFRRMESARTFRDKYVARFPEDSTYSPEAYDAVMLLAESLASASEPTRAGVLEAFRAKDRFNGVTGSIAFDGSGERLDAPVSWYRVVKTSGERRMEYQGTL